MASIFKRRKGRQEPYTIQYLDHNGKRKTVKGFTDKGLTEELAAKLESEARQRTSGLIDASQDRVAGHKQANIDGQLTAFEESLADNTPKYIKLTMTRVRSIVDGCEFTSLGSIEAENVQVYLRSLRKAGEIGHRTYNHYLQAFDTFCNWCVKTKRLFGNPVLGLERLNAATDIRHPRRALTPDEVRRLVDAARTSGKHVQRLSPELRARAYLFSYLTGLRKQEMASLTGRSFRLDDDPATVTVEASVSKHRRKDVLPLHPELVIMLREWLASMQPGAKLFPLLGKKRLSVMIERDLKRAGIPYKTEEGIADFHAAGRHTYITQLLRSGATLPEAQKLARHSDINMTMRYTHIGIEDQAKAVANLPIPQNTSAPETPPESGQDRALQMRCICGGAKGHELTSAGNANSRRMAISHCYRKDFDAYRRQLATSVKAEGTGLEPATGKPAPEFQSGR